MYGDEIQSTLFDHGRGPQVRLQPLKGLEPWSEHLVHLLQGPFDAGRGDWRGERTVRRGPPQRPSQFVRGTPGDWARESSSGRDEMES